jgi:2-dehydropantoate 2-reductase
MRELLAVTATVAEKSGHPLGPSWFDDTLSLLTRDGSSFTASMLRDMERDGRVESDHIVGDMLHRAETLDIPHDILKVIYTHLQTYEHRRDHAPRA